MAVARWLFDEASSGQAPTTVADSEASPVDLSITYGATSAWSSIAAGNGLTGNNLTQRLRCGSASLTGTKIGTALNGLKKISLEFVVSLDAMVGTELYTPFLFINDDTSSYPLIAHWVRSGGVVQLELWSNSIGLDPTPIVITGALPASPTVVRIDIDTAQVTAGNRCKVWYNGSLQTIASGTVTQDATFPITGTVKLWTHGFDGGWGEDGIKGTLYYLSLDDVVPSTDNSTNLLADNDADPSGPPPPTFSAPKGWFDEEWS